MELKQATLKRSDFLLDVGWRRGEGAAEPNLQLFRVGFRGGRQRGGYLLLGARLHPRRWRRVLQFESSLRVRTCMAQYASIFPDEETAVSALSS